MSIISAEQVDVEAVPVEGEVEVEAETDAAQVPLIVVKRQAPELTADCMVYRYGSLATSVQVVRKSMLLQQFKPIWMVLLFAA